MGVRQETRIVAVGRQGLRPVPSAWVASGVRSDLQRCANTSSASSASLSGLRLDENISSHSEVCVLHNIVNLLYKENMLLGLKVSCFLLLESGAWKYIRVI